MLRFDKNKSLSTLSHRRSSSSLTTTQHHFDPETARRHAHAAALCAFNRAQGKVTAEYNTIYGLPANRAAMANQDHRPHSLLGETGSEGREIRRQQSVRFVKAGALEWSDTRKLRTSDDQNVWKASPSRRRPRALTNDTLVPASYRPPSRSSSIGKASLRGSNEANIALAMATYCEYYTNEDGIASVPSSYRHIRKSKSMLSEPRASSIYFHDGTPDNKASVSPQRARYLRLRAPKSMSFLKSSSDRQFNFFVHPDADTRNQGPRHNLLQDVKQKHVRERPSLLFPSGARRERAFRHSMRSSSSNIYGSPIASPNPLQLPKRGKFRTKARRVSLTIKNKLKGLFHRNDENEDLAIPHQQVEAQGSHSIQLYAEDDENIVPRTFDGATPDKTNLLHVPSRFPHLHTTPFSPQFKSQAASVRSLQSDRSTKSRVESPASIREDPRKGRYTAAERVKEQQRLSIIQENGSHISSLSLRLPSLGKDRFACSEIRPLQRHDSSVDTDVDPATFSLQPRNIPGDHCALMRRLDENSPQAKLAQRKSSVLSLHAPFEIPERVSPVTEFSNPSAESLAPPYHIPPRRSSVNSLISGDAHECHTPSTIKRANTDTEKVAVTSGKKIISLRHAHDYSEYNGDDVFSPEYISLHGNRNKHRYNESDSSLINFQTVNVPSIAMKAEQNDNEVNGHESSQRNRSFERIAMPSSSSGFQRKTGGLRERGSGLFASAAYIVDKTESPYRKAMAKVKSETHVANEGSSVKPNFIKDKLVRSTSESEENVAVASPARPEIAYSESIYSRTTSGRTPGASESTVTLAIPRGDYDFSSSIAEFLSRPPTQPGDAVILERATYKPKRRAHRTSNSGSSSDWKTWMSTRISTLDFVEEGGSKVARTPCADHAETWPKSRQTGSHIREHAQINNERLKVKPSLTTKVDEAVCDLLTSRSQKMSRSVHQDDDSTSKCDCNPMHIGIGDHTSMPSPIPNPPPLPPPVPQRSPLRLIQSKTSLQSPKLTSNVFTHTQKRESSPVSPQSRVTLRKKSNSSARSGETHGIRLRKRIDRQSSSSGTRTSSSQGGQRATDYHIDSVNLSTPQSATGSSHIWSTEGIMAHSSKENENRTSANDISVDNYEATSVGRLEHCTSISEPRAAESQTTLLDALLSFRRRRMISSDESSAFV